MANLITSVRILCGLVMLFVPAFSTWFYALFMIGGISDGLDGWTARRLGEVSDFGARLDTVADMVFFAVVLAKVFVNFTFPIWVILWVICIAVLRITSIVVGLFLNNRLVSEHSVLNRTAGLLLFLIPLCIRNLPWQVSAVLVVVTCGVATIASAQELYSVLKQ